MAQKQTDYEKALEICRNNTQKSLESAIATKEPFDTTGFVFRQGYEYGKKQSTADHERNLIALGDDYMTARKNMIQTGLLTVKGKSIYEAYRLGWNDSDAFDDEWTKQHPKDLLDRLLADHPEIIEEIKRETVEEYLKIHQNLAEQDILDAMNQISNNMWKDATSDHFRDSTKMMRYEIAKECLKSMLSNQAIKQSYSAMAFDAVNFADALIKELGKEEE